MRSHKQNDLKKDLSRKNNSNFSDSENDSSDACEENHSENSENANLDFEELIDHGSDCSTQEIIKSNALARSNSLTFDEKGTPSSMRYSNRNTTGELSAAQAIMQDAVVISLISLEAGAKFYKNYHKYLKKNKTHNAVVTGSIKPTIFSELTRRVNYKQAAIYADVFSEILRNKEPAHFVPIIEGPRAKLPASFVAEDNLGKKYEYKLHDIHIEGKNARGHKDEKQSMNFYVRSGMENVFEFKEIEITCDNKQKFVIAEITFSNEEDQKFSLAVVHVPNRLASDEKQVHAAFENYAKKREAEDKVLLTCYMGDTNFKKVIQKHSKPSLGGNQGEKYISPTSSGAAIHTDFMQAISLTESPRVKLNQPSTLNQVEIKGNHQSTPAKTDHPSVQVIIQIDSKIKNKPKKMPSRRKGALFPEEKPKNEDETKMPSSISSPR